MDSLSAYLPQDRRAALAHATPLPATAIGTALFADISGFTPLTEAFAQALGPRRGADAVPRQINAVYEALLAGVDACGGTVIGFAGDSVTCWFAEGLFTRAALAAAQLMQQAMAGFAAVPHPAGGTLALTVKIALATGPARRFLVGDPAIQVLEVLAGATLDRMAAGEHLAGPGEILVDRGTKRGIPGRAAAWRRDPATGERFAVLRPVSSPALLTPATAAPPASDLPEAVVRPWLLPTVYERLTAGQGEFFTEIRPAAACFIRFGGLDYDHDHAAPERLDAYIRWVQSVVTRTEGSLIDLTLGDKGSYLYAAWGAPVAHEDDPVRAALAALELRVPPPGVGDVGPVQIGLNLGEMRTGAYGSTTRRAYGVLGDAVNLAARLMQAVAPGQILATERFQAATGAHFTWEPLPAIRVKGKQNPVAVAALLDSQQTTVRLHEPRYAHPLVGRQAELAAINARLAAARAGQGAIILVSGEAGVGKSRVVAEAIRAGQAAGWTIHGGAAQALGTASPYLAWRPIWQAIFDLTPTDPPATQQAHIAARLADWLPEAAARLPLLGPLLGLDIPDTALTAGMDEKLRKESREALLVELLRVYARRTPVVLVLEDAHWLDPLSEDLLEALARAIAGLPVILLLAARPSDRTQPASLRLRGLPHLLEVPLDTLNAEEARAVLERRLAATRPGETLPAGLADRLVERAEGNPFYLEEVLLYLLEQGVDLSDPAAVADLELPTSLHSLILSRVDQVGARAQLTAKAASILGRLVRVADLVGYDPALGPAEAVVADLGELARGELTVLDSPIPEIVYLFKHIMTHEAIYSSLTDEVRARLHEQVAAWLEASGSADLDLLAFHYGRSANVAKRRDYLRRAGDAALAAYNNLSAVEYYTRLLANLPAGDTERAEVLVARGDAHERLSEWAAAGADYEAARQESAAPRAMRTTAARGLGILARHQGHYDDAIRWATQAHDEYEAAGETLGALTALVERGEVYILQGAYGPARAVLDAALAGADSPAAHVIRAQALNAQGNIAAKQADYATARQYYEVSLALRRELGDRAGIARTLANFGIVVSEQGDNAEAGRLFEESLALRRELGDRAGVAASLGTLGLRAANAGDNATARTRFEESLALARDIGDRPAIARFLGSLGVVLYLQADFAGARARLEEARALEATIGHQRGLAQVVSNLGMVDYAEGDYESAAARYRESLALNRALDDRVGMIHNTCNLGLVAYVQGAYPVAHTFFAESLALAETVGHRSLMAFNYTYLALTTRRQGDLAGARRLVGTSLDLAAALGPGESLQNALVASAWMLEAAQAVALLGVVTALQRTLGGQLEPILQQAYDTVQAQAQAALDLAAYADAFAAGQGQAWESAVAATQAALAVLP